MVKLIDDWYSYHEMLGEVHCGTNVCRKPFTLP
ncbi:protein-arginine deiminase family protein [Paenibacillus oleatilyticus]